MTALSDDEKRALRAAFGRFATGVTVITTRQPDGTPRGFTANSFTSVSLDPPLLLVCPAKSAQSCDTFAKAPHFAVNILSDAQKDVSNLFASRSADKFEHTAWQAGPQDMPLIDGALAHFTCAQHNLVEAGDHLILIGQVLSHATHQGQPLGYYNGSYFDLGFETTLANAASQSPGSTLAAVLANGDCILLQDAPGGGLQVPRAPHDAATVAGFTQALTVQGLTARLDHLYAVFDNSQTGTQSIIYHGQVSGPASSGLHYHPLVNLPLDRISSPAERSMLARYVREHRHGQFGLYHGTEARGLVHSLASPTEYSV